MKVLNNLKIVFIITLIISLLSCKGYNQESISFKPSKTIVNSPYNFALTPLAFLDSIDPHFINYPKLDTFKFERLYQGGLDRLFRKNAPDSLKNNHLNVFSGIRNDSTIIIVDQNKDYDFGNDKPIYIEKNIRDSLPYSLSYREKIPYISHDFGNGFSYKFKIFPYYGYYTEIRDTITESVRLVSQTNEFWYGEFNLNETVFSNPLFSISMSTTFGSIVQPVGASIFS